MAAKLGSLIKVPDVPGKWSVWSAAPGPGQVYVVPADSAAREDGRTFLTVKITESTRGPQVTLQ